MQRNGIASEEEEEEEERMIRGKIGEVNGKESLHGALGQLYKYLLKRLTDSLCPESLAPPHDRKTCSPPI